MNSDKAHIRLLEDELLKRVIRVCERQVGFKLLTLMKYNARSNSACRIFSTDDNNYPTGGYKPIPNNQWATQVIERQENFMANDISEIKKVFFDFQLISDMGLASALNVPIISNGVVLGIVNLLHIKNSYSLASSRNIKKLSPWFIQLFELK